MRAGPAAGARTPTARTRPRSAHWDPCWADPAAAAPLSDAGLTPYHAIKNSLPVLSGGGKSALVIGLGGLGQLAVQMLSALTGAQIIATDMKDSAMQRAEQAGEVTGPGGDDQAERIRELTGGRSVDVVFDFVGVSTTIKVAMSVVALQAGTLEGRTVVVPHGR